MAFISPGGALLSNGVRLMARCFSLPSVDELAVRRLVAHCHLGRRDEQTHAK